MGMHRSGTSLVGHLLHDAGMNILNTLGSDASSPDGYYEDLDTLIKNDRILSFNNGKWDSPPDMMQGLFQWDTVCDAVKDPRFCLTFPVWQFPKDTKFVKVVRNKEDVIKSLVKRDDMTEFKASNLYDHYNKLMRSHHCHSITVSYEDLLKKKLKKLSKFVGKELNKDVIRA